MREIENYDENFLNEIEEKSLKLDLDKYGFNYTRDEFRDELEDDNIFNSLLKTKRYRSIELKKKWVEIKIAEMDNNYYLLNFDVRKDTDYPEIFKLISPVDNTIINHIKSILKPNDLKNTIYLKELLKNIIVKNLSSIGATEDKVIISNHESLIQVTAAIRLPFKLSALFDEKENSNADNKKMLYLIIKSDNGKIFFSNIFYLNSLEDFDGELKKYVNEISQTLNEALKNNSPDDLIGIRKNKRKSTIYNNKY